MNRQCFNQESDKEFFTRQAAKIANLKKAGKDEEARECFREIGNRLVPIVEQFIDCESAQYKLDENTKFMSSEKVYDVVERDFYKFNNPEYMKQQLSRYEMDGVVEGLPQKLDTILGREFGEIDLSGGQWQKLAIARGGLKPSSLIILDEPTASIDPITESEIFERFKQFTKECCSVIISHRIGAARIANRILVLEQGHLIEDGTHEELMKQQGVYQKLYKIQAQWYVS